VSRPRKSTTYRAVHKCLRVDRGRARDFACSRCSAEAREWAYFYNGNPELRSPDGKRYALDQDCYEPMCSSCHKKWDHQQDPERHAVKTQKARERITAMNKDPKYHEVRVANSRQNGHRSIARMREDSTLRDFTSKGGKARHEKF
jgi:hypothetical protein